MKGPVTTIRMPKELSLNSTRQREPLAEKKRKCVLSTYEFAKRWVAVERAEQPEDDIEREILEQARHLMHLSGLKKLPAEVPSHKSLQTDLYLWKKASKHTLSGVRYYNDMSFTYVLCVIIASVCTVCGYWLAAILSSISKCDLHDASSHENDGSKYFKYDRIVSVHDAAISVPQLSGAQLRRNMQLADSPSKQIEVRV